jgi:hypothetical protein
MSPFYCLLCSRINIWFKKVFNEINLKKSMMKNNKSDFCFIAYRKQKSSEWVSLEL